MTTPRQVDPPADGRQATEVIATLGLEPHPEGGWYAETWRAPAVGDARPSSSAILYLLAAGERSHWHRVDADEIWQHVAGAPLELRTSADGRELLVHRLGWSFGGELVVPQVVVPAGTWQAARSLGTWTLVGCIVAPAFSFDGFELAPLGWEPSA